jgi:hypothetical protein
MYKTGCFIHCGSVNKILGATHRYSLGNLTFDEGRLGSPDKGNDVQELEVPEGTGKEEVDDKDSENDQMQMVESKDERDRIPVQSFKRDQMITRGQMERKRADMGRIQDNDVKRYVSVDGYGAESYSGTTAIEVPVPTTINQALRLDEAKQWEQAMEEEMRSMEMAEVWGPPVRLPDGCRATQLKFIFVKKLGERGEVQWNKARLVFVNKTVEDG